MAHHPDVVAAYLGEPAEDATDGGDTDGTA
ncbi:hypothetical protein [Egibacter rhizosphaerae]